MNRIQTIQYLKQFIPSFQRKYIEIEAEFYGPMGWIAIDQGYIPETIPTDLFKGVSVERNGKIFSVMSCDDFKRKFEQFDLPPGRHCTIEYHGFGGNPHLYGTLRMSGYELVHYNAAENRVITTGGCGDEKEPELKGMTYSYETMVGRIVTQEEIDTYPGQWDNYDAGCRTNRFLDAKELIATAAYIVLTRVEGPSFLTLGNSYYYQEKNLLMTVSENEEITFTKLFNQIINPNK